MMRKIFFPYITTVILSILILACKSGSEPASANPAFGDDGKVKLKPTLVYEDSTLAENKAIIHRLDSFYRLQVRAGFNGSVLIGRKGKVVYERYFGLANREEQLKLNPASASQLASTSKTFTAAAILYLHEHKYIDINQKVSEYIKDFPYPAITVKMLLNHRSGIADYTKWVPRYLKDQRTPISNNKVMRMFAQYKPALEFRPDTRFKYSNSNYAILASIIEEVTEVSYADFMKAYFFEPLGMQHTFAYQPTLGYPEGTARSYKNNWIRESDMFADGVVGDKGIYSTVEDLYRWDQSFYNHVLLNNETIELAYGPCSFEKPGVKNYGLGWRMFCYADGRKIIYHNGWWHGNNTVFYRFIQDNFTIIVLGNKYNPSIYRQTKVVNALVKNIPVSDTFEDE
jgi:CubicO group peptidase (beta-lactamase class C family)